MATTNMRKRQFQAAFRDCNRKGMSFDKALATSLGVTRDADPPGIKRDEAGKFTGHAVSKTGKTLHTTEGHPSHEAAAKAALAAKPTARSISTGRGYNGNFDIRFHRPDQVRNYSTGDAGGVSDPIEGALEVYHSVKELHAKLSEGFEGEHEHGEHKERGTNPHAPTVKAPAVHNVHGAGTPAPAAVAVKAPAVTAPTVPKVPSAPKAAPSAQAAVMNPPGSRPAKTKDSKVPVYHKDAATRFKATFRDGVRENLPLPKLIEMAVISGTSSKPDLPESEGKEYAAAGPTKDAFTAAFRGAVAKGVSTRDAIAAALRGQVRN